MTGEDAEPSRKPSKTAIYEGLSSEQKMKIIRGSAWIAVINLLAAWVMAGYALRALPTDMTELTDLYNTLSTSSAPLIDKSSNARPYELAKYVLDASHSMKNLINAHAIRIICIGSAFSLISIGFALFLIGADGAFKLQKSDGDSKLLLVGTAPGLLCFVLAAFLVFVALPNADKYRGYEEVYEKDAPKGANKSHSGLPTLTGDT